MVCDIHLTIEVKHNERWETVTQKMFPMEFPFEGETHTASPFDWRSYGMFGFLADVRNYSFVPPISEPRGLPTDRDYDLDGNIYYGYHSFSWLRLDELLSFDYDAGFEDRRTCKQLSPNVFTGAADAGVGNGTPTTFRKFLGENFFRDLEIMRRIDPDPQNVRIVFGFDS